MTMDLEQLFEPKKVKFDTLKVYHKESGEVRLIKSTRFDSRYHSMNIPRNAVEKLDFNHPNKAIELSPNDLKAPSAVPVEKVDTSTVSDIRTPDIQDFKAAAAVLDSAIPTDMYPIVAYTKDGLVIKDSTDAEPQYPCSKGCGKVCTSNAGRAAHERACKFVTQ